MTIFYSWRLWERECPEFCVTHLELIALGKDCCDQSAELASAATGGFVTFND